MRNHIAFMIFIMALALAPEAAHALGQAFMINVDLFGSCNSIGTVFDSPCSLNLEDGVASAISCRVIKAVNSGVIPIICNIIDNPDYQTMLNALLTLYVIIWGIMIIGGITQAKFGIVMIRLLKAAIIYALASNASFYFNHVYTFVMLAPQEVVKIMLDTAGQEQDDFFKYIDQGIFSIFNNLFYPEVQSAEGSSYQKMDLRIVVLVLAAWKLVPGVGGYIFALFYIVVFGWLFAFITVVVRYILALMILNFLLVMGPIFIPTFLFDRSKFLGEEWMRMMINFMIQIIIVVAFILMVQEFFTAFINFIKMGMNETVLNKDFNYSMQQYGADFGRVEKELGTTFATSEQYVSQLEKPDGVETTEDFIKWFFFQLIVMATISVLTFSFMKDVVPYIGATLSSNFKFLSAFAQGTNEGMLQMGKAPTRMKLFNQNGGGNGKARQPDKHGATVVSDT